MLSSCMSTPTFESGHLDTPQLLLVLCKLGYKLTMRRRQRRAARRRRARRRPPSTRTRTTRIAAWRWPSLAPPVRCNHTSCGRPMAWGRHALQLPALGIDLIHGFSIPSITGPFMQSSDPSVCRHCCARAVAGHYLPVLPSLKQRLSGVGHHPWPHPRHDRVRGNIPETPKLLTGLCLAVVQYR